jgi:tetratricopeptide (TPR) repeat protein
MMRVLFVFILLLPFIANAQSKKNHLRNGNDLYQDSLFNDAEMKYRKSLEKDQDYFPASYNLADAIYKQERYEESANLFDALTDNAKTKNEKAKIYHNLGNSLLKQQKIKESIAAYKDALRNSPTDKDTRHNLALAQKMLQQQQQNKEQQQNQQQDKEDEKEQKEQKEQEKQEQQKEQQPQEKEGMSKETAEKILEALQQQEKKLQEKLQKKKVKGKKVKVLKDW